MSISDTNNKNNNNIIYTCCLCKNQFDKLYYHYCKTCCDVMFPDIDSDKNMTKEKKIVQIIIKQFKNRIWSYDKRIIGGTSGRRPDLFTDLKTHVIIIEIDEKAHKDYKTDIGKRMTDISNDVGQRPCVFIHFNPDAYYVESGNKIPSCWDNKTGEWCIKYVNDWNSRIKTLINTVLFWIENVPEGRAKIVKLFFDSNNITKVNNKKTPSLDKYYCSLCDYSAGTNTNLHIHFKTKKHTQNEEKNSKSNKKLISLFTRINKEIKTEICKRKMLVLTNFDDLRKEMNDLVNVKAKFITKTQDDSSYICTECEQTFDNNNSYKTHTYTCQQIGPKYKLLASLNVELVCQVKQLLEICKYSDNGDEEADVIELDKTQQNLSKQNDKLKLKYDALKKQNVELHNKHNDLEKQMIRIQINYDNIKDKYEEMQIQNKETKTQHKDFNMTNQLIEFLEKTKLGQ